MGSTVSTAPETDSRPAVPAPRGAKTPRGGKVPHRTKPAPRRPRRPAVLAIVAAALVAVAVTVAGIVVLLNRSGHDVPTAPPYAEIPLPGQVLGLSPQKVSDPTQSAIWATQVKFAGINGDTRLAARTYGGPSPARTVRIVATRTDLTGKLELAWRADAGHLVGKVSCTNNVTISERTKVRPTVMLCWRTTATFSAYSLIIDPKSKGVADTDGAKAVEAVWRAALKAE